MAPIDTSEPVPAVVGMQTSGAIGSGAPMPSSSRGIRKKPSCSRAVPPWVNSASAILAVSITEPPADGEERVGARGPGLLGAALADVGRRVLGHVVEHARDLKAAVLDPGDHLVDQAGAADHAGR